METLSCTLSEPLYTTSAWRVDWRTHSYIVCGGYWVPATEPNNWMWWRTRIKVTIPQFTGTGSAVLFKLITNRDCKAHNSYAIISDKALDYSQVGTLTTDSSVHGCTCGDSNLQHEIPSSTLVAAKISDSYAYIDEDATVLASDVKSGTALYYKFNSEDFKSGGTYYIYLLYKHRVGSFHTYVSGTKYSANLLYEDNRTLTVQAKINDKIVPNFGNYAAVRVNSQITYCSTYSEELKYNSIYRVYVSVPPAKSNLYHYDGAKLVTGILLADTTKTLVFRTKSKLSFDSNGGSYVDPIYKVFGSDVVLPSCSREGYTFVGWKCGDTLYNASQRYTIDPQKPLTENNIINDETYEYIFTAQWQPISYLVTFDGNGGTVSDTNKTVYYGSTFGELPTATRDGYTFCGWYTKIDSGYLVTSNTQVNTHTSITLYARWSTDSYIIQYISDNKIIPELTTTVAYGSTYTIQPPIVKYGSQFISWTDPNGNSWQPGSSGIWTFLNGQYGIVDRTLKLKASFSNVPALNVYKNKVWKVVIPHMYIGGTWKKLYSEVNMNSSWQEFKYYNW